MDGWNYRWYDKGAGAPWLILGNMGSPPIFSAFSQTKIAWNSRSPSEIAM